MVNLFAAVIDVAYDPTSSEPTIARCVENSAMVPKATLLFTVIGPRLPLNVVTVDHDPETPPPEVLPVGGDSSVYVTFGPGTFTTMTPLYNWRLARPVPR